MHRDGEHAHRVQGNSRDNNTGNELRVMDFGKLFSSRQYTYYLMYAMLMKI